MAAHPGDLCIVFIVIRILSHKNTEKYFSLEEIAAFSGVSLDDIKILKANQ